MDNIELSKEKKIRKEIAEKYNSWRKITMLSMPLTFYGSGNAGKILKVKDDLSGLEFTDSPVLANLQLTEHVYFKSEVDNGNSGSVDTIDWTKGNKQKSTLTNNCTFAFTNASGPCNLLLKLIQDEIGNRTVVWPSNVNWVGEDAPVLSTEAGSIDIICFYFDGTDYFGGTSLAQYTDEKARDAIGSILDDGSVGGIVFTYDDEAEKISGVVQDGKIDHDNLANGGAHDYSYISDNDDDTDVTAAELEELTNGSKTALHSHAEEGGVTTFLDLNDTPGSYDSDDAGRYIRVKNDLSGLEFITGTGEGVASFLDLNDTPASYVPADIGKVVKVSDNLELKFDDEKVKAVLSFVIDGGGNVITAGIKGNLEVPFKCTIQSISLLADQVGAIVIDIWKSTYVNFPPMDADSITASAPPTIIATADKSQDFTLSGWTTSLIEGDILRFNVDSATDIQRITLSLKVNKT